MRRFIIGGMLVALMAMSLGCGSSEKPQTPILKKRVLPGHEEGKPDGKDKAGRSGLEKAWAVLRSPVNPV
jgi:hypothetical protein